MTIFNEETERIETEENQDVAIVEIEAQGDDPGDEEETEEDPEEIEVEEEEMESEEESEESTDG